MLQCEEAQHCFVCAPNVFGGVALHLIGIHNEW
jgi:hypothetical protein